MEMNRQAATHQLSALMLLLPAVALEVSGLGFVGLDLLVGLLLAASTGLASLSLLRGGSRAWGLITAAVALLCLVFHICLNFDLF